MMTKKSILKIKSLFSTLFIFSIKLYRYFISPVIPKSCRFYPSCSVYAETAIKRFGILRGGWLTIKRLLRCHPWCEGGIDEVPMGRLGGGEAG